jgi:hypothetical protein
MGGNFSMAHISSRIIDPVTQDDIFEVRFSTGDKYNTVSDFRIIVNKTMQELADQFIKDNKEMLIEAITPELIQTAIRDKIISLLMRR